MPQEKLKLPLAVLVLIFTAYVLFGVTSCAQSAEKIKITVGMWPEALASSLYEAEMFTEIKNKFEKDYPVYEIVSSPYTYSPNTITAKAVSGQLPVVFKSYCSETAWLSQSGYISNVASELDRLEWLGKMDPVLKRMLTVNGGVYGLPHSYGGFGMFLNLDMLFSAGVIGKNADGSYALYDSRNNPLYPRTFDDIKKASQAVRDHYGNETYGTVILSDDTYGGRQFVNFAWNFGAKDFQLRHEDGDWVSNLNSTAAENAMRWIQDMRKSDMLVYPSAYLGYSEWYKNIGTKKVAIAFCSADALSLPVVNHAFPLEDMAFVPMPTGNGSSRFSVADGEAYMFSAKATLQQLKGALLFLKYLGRSPETDKTSLEGLEAYYKTMRDSSLPIVPSVKWWDDPVYLEAAAKIEDRYVNVNTAYFSDFLNSYGIMKREEDPNYRKAMYGILDSVIQHVLSDPFGVNLSKLLYDANVSFSTEYLSRV